MSENGTHPVRVIGRIILAGVSIAMMVFAIISAINVWNDLVAMGGWDWTLLFGGQEGDLAVRAALIWKFIGECATMLAAAIGILAALIGKKSFLLGLCALLLLVPAVIAVVKDVQGGTQFSWELVLDYLRRFGLPVGYFIGFLFL